MKLRTALTLAPFASFLLLTNACGTPADPALEDIDKDKDAVADDLGHSIDADGDGVADLCDLDMDGSTDGIGVDTDNNGTCDAIGIDTDNDNILDALDTDGDGNPDQTGGDGDGDLTASGGGAGTGGAPGSGGSPSGGGGSGGSDVSTGGGASGGSPNTGSACADADILCVDFEDTAAGTKPSGSPWEADGCTAPSYMASVTAGSGMSASQGFVTSNAASSSNTCALVHKLSAAPVFHVRAWIKIGGSNPAGEHEVTFFELGEVLGDDPELRIGYRGDSSCNNSGAVYAGFEIGATKGPGGEFTGCTGNIPVADEWYCLEVHVDQSGTGMVATLDVDGVKQDTLVHSMPKEEILGDFHANYLKVGMQSYAGAFGSLAIDDVSISTTPLGCPTK